MSLTPLLLRRTALIAKWRESLILDLLGNKNACSTVSTSISNNNRMKNQKILLSLTIYLQVNWLGFFKKFKTIWIIIGIISNKLVEGIPAMSTKVYSLSSSLLKEYKRKWEDSFLKIRWMSLKLNQSQLKFHRGNFSIQLHNDYWSQISQISLILSKIVQLSQLNNGWCISIKFYN